MNKRKYEVSLATIDEDRYKVLLSTLEITKLQLSKDMGVAYATVKSWYTKDKTMPLYAQRYLELALELKKYKESREQLIEIRDVLNKLDI